MSEKDKVLETLDAHGAGQDKLALVDRLLDNKHGDGRPRIHLTPDRVACPGHMAPFRERWPVGWPVFSLELLDRVIRNPKVQAELDPAQDMVAAFNHLLDQCPMCCRATPKMLLEVYEVVGQQAATELGAPLWPVHRCVRCRKRNRAALIQVQVPGTMQPSHLWVCLPCIARYRSPQATSYGRPSR